MEKPAAQKKSNLLKWMAVAIVAILISSIVLYRLYLEAPSKLGIEDPENDVIINMGTEYPGMIDVLNAALNVNGETLNITINVKDPISGVGAGEHAQWNVTVIVLNNVTKTYEVCVDLNSTLLSGYVVEIEGLNAKTCQVETYKNSLTIHTLIDELQSANEVQWFILTTFETYSENVLTFSGNDIAPDEGLQTTLLTK